MSDVMVDKVKEFWDDMAREHGPKDTATAPDTAYRGLEIARIIPHIKGRWVCDVGCGNGYSTLKFKESYPTKGFLGVDYSEDMIVNANISATVERSDIAFVVGNVLELSKLKVSKFDTIISERCLINLASWQEQKDALLEMNSCLMPNGRIIVAENFTDGLANLNMLRQEFGLHEIKVRWHNRYLGKDEFENFAHKHFKVVHKENIGNLYYIISRVVYAALAKRDGDEPEYSNPINYIAAKLPSLGEYNFSPNMLYVLERR